jgi:hypothetical protein
MDSQRHAPTRVPAASRIDGNSRRGNRTSLAAMRLRAILSKGDGKQR